MKIYGSIEKTEPQDDGTIKVWGYASSEVVDSSGEVVSSEAMKAAIPDYMAFGAVREMHDATKAAGTAIEIEVQEDGRTYFGAHVVDSEAVKKVQHGVYKGFSIGGKVLLRDEVQKNTITGLKLSEISLVDRPANPEAKFTMFKADGADEPEAPCQPAGAPAGKEANEPAEAIGQQNNAEQLQKIADILAGMGVVVGSRSAEKVGEGYDLQKADELQKSFSDLQKRHDELETEAKKLRESNDAIMKAAGAAGAEVGAEVTEFIAKQAEKINRLEEMPEAPKAVLKAVGKAEDSVGHEASGTEDVVKNADGSVNEVASELKKIHRTGGYVTR
ncbi:MAG: caudovirus prohead protease [Chlorobiaceae bacterium]|nr:caudovirus prohead protease [Chlorobiaceae bacterium]